jgi:hypothetical protein
MAPAAMSGFGEGFEMAALPAHPSEREDGELPIESIRGSSALAQDVIRYKWK